MNSSHTWKNSCHNVALSCALLSQFIKPNIYSEQKDLIIAAFFLYTCTFPLYIAHSTMMMPLWDRSYKNFDSSWSSSQSEHIFYGTKESTEWTQCLFFCGIHYKMYFNPFWYSRDIYFVSLPEGRCVTLYICTDTFCAETDFRNACCRTKASSVRASLTLQIWRLLTRHFFCIWRRLGSKLSEYESVTFSAVSAIHRSLFNFTVSPYLVNVML